jgi:D-aspartate ligase
MAVVLGGGPIAVPVARSLARAGIDVEALGSRLDPVRYSRCCRRFMDLGAGEGVQERWFAWFSCREARGAVILPCNDDGLELLGRRRRDLLELGYHPSEIREEVLLAMLDKHRTYELARQAGVPVPRTLLVRPGDRFRELLAELEYPCAAKPRHAHLFQRHFGLATKALVARDRGELEAHLAGLEAYGLEMLVTEIIPGGDDAYHSYYTYVDREGEPLFDLTKRKLRQYPVGFGLATYHATDHDLEAIALGRRFVTGIGLRGLAVSEFKRDARDGRLKLIECNHRFTLATGLVCHAGVDLPLLAYERALGRPGPPVSGYRVGVRMWHPVEDARAFVDLRRQGAMSLPAWLRSLLHPQHFPLFDWRDPVPSARSLSRFLKRPFRRFKR